MKKAVLLLGILLNWGLVQAEYTQSATPRMSLGIDTALPYTIAIDGNSVNSRNNVNLGMDYRYFTSDNLNFGLRFAMDVEKQLGSVRQYSISPVVQYQWFQGHTWMPYFRSDLPVVLNGAPSSTGSTSEKDFGVSIGGGLAWNLGNQIGINNMILRYDFSASYLFGFGGALNMLSVEFFRIGVDYRF